MKKRMMKMINFLEFINKDITAKKTMITSMPANRMLNLSKLIKTLSRINYISSFFTIKAKKNI